MAKDVLGDNRVYDPTKDKPQQKQGLTRRDALRVATGLAIGAVVGEIVTRPESPKSNLELLLEQGVKPTDVFIGDIRITKGKNDIMLNVRSAPNTNPDSSISSWLNIVKFNHVNIQYVNEFLIKNALLVEGEYVDNPAGTKGQKGLWIVANVGTSVLGFKEEKPKYISHSSSIGQLVVTLNGEFHKIAQLDKNGIVTNKGQIIPADQLGLVTSLAKAA